MDESELVRMIDQGPLGTHVEIGGQTWYTKPPITAPVGTVRFTAKPWTGLNDRVLRFIEGFWSTRYEDLLADAGMTVVTTHRNSFRTVEGSVTRRFGESPLVETALVRLYFAALSASDGYDVTSFERRFPSMTLAYEDRR